MSWSCVPYLYENVPPYHEIVAFSESSATPYVNSVIEAYTNREVAQSALAAGVIGNTQVRIACERKQERHISDVTRSKTHMQKKDANALGQYIDIRFKG